MWLKLRPVSSTKVCFLFFKLYNRGHTLFETGLKITTTMSNNRSDFEFNNYYHIYNRGLDKKIIFKCEDDFARFYSYVVRYQKDYSESIKIVSYCFLPNHFHMVIHVIETGLNLSSFMKKLQGAYAMHFKRKYNTDNSLKWPLYEWRFKAKLIDSEEYLYQCIAYVCLNPIKHKIVEDINDYQRTSYHQLEDKHKVMNSRDLELKELEM